MAETTTTAPVKLVEETCRVPGCDRPRVCRGLCKKCHDKSRHPRGHELLRYMLPPAGHGGRKRGRPSSAAPGRDIAAVDEKPAVTVESSTPSDGGLNTRLCIALDDIRCAILDSGIVDRRDIDTDDAELVPLALVRALLVVAHAWGTERQQLRADRRQWQSDLVALKAANQTSDKLQRELEELRKKLDHAEGMDIGLRGGKPMPTARARLRFVQFIGDKDAILGEVVGSGRIPIAEEVEAIDFDVVVDGGAS